MTVASSGLITRRRSGTRWNGWPLGILRLFRQAVGKALWHDGSAIDIDSELARLKAQVARLTWLVEGNAGPDDGAGHTIPDMVTVQLGNVDGDIKIYNDLGESR